MRFRVRAGSFVALATLLLLAMLAPSATAKPKGPGAFEKCGIVECTTYFDRDATKTFIDQMKSKQHSTELCGVGGALGGALDKVPNFAKALLAACAIDAYQYSNIIFNSQKFYDRGNCTSFKYGRFTTGYIHVAEVKTGTKNCNVPRSGGGGW